MTLEETRGANNTAWNKINDPINKEQDKASLPEALPEAKSRLIKVVAGYAVSS